MKRIIIMSVVITMLLGTGMVFAKGNNAPSGSHYNLNIIGVPNELNANFDGGNGARIFVLRTGVTQFYVQGGDFYEVLDHNGTDGRVGTSIDDPGIIFPQNSETLDWGVQIWVRLAGPRGSEVKWTSYYYDTEGFTWVLYTSFTMSKSSKFNLRTNDLLKDGYQNMLWVLDPVSKFRICQMRIYLDE